MAERNNACGKPVIGLEETGITDMRASSCRVASNGETYMTTFPLVSLWSPFGATQNFKVTEPHSKYPRESITKNKAAYKNSCPTTASMPQSQLAVTAARQLSQMMLMMQLLNKLLAIAARQLPQMLMLQEQLATQACVATWPKPAQPPGQMMHDAASKPAGSNGCPTPNDAHDAALEQSAGNSCQATTSNDAHDEGTTGF